MYFKTKQSGFTLIELLVVIAIIGLLATIVMIGIGGSRQKANIAKVKMDMTTIIKAMVLYEGDTGELPRRGDNCSEIYCCAGGNINAPNCVSEWSLTMTALTTNDGVGWNGPYLGTPLLSDPWGHHFLYDDNYVNSNCGDSWIRSAGPDGTAETSDDIRMDIFPNPVTGCF